MQRFSTVTATTHHQACPADGGPRGGQGGGAVHLGCGPGAWHADACGAPARRPRRLPAARQRPRLPQLPPQSLGRLDRLKRRQGLPRTLQQAPRQEMACAWRCAQNRTIWVTRREPTLTRVPWVMDMRIHRQEDKHLGQLSLQQAAHDLQHRADKASSAQAAHFEQGPSTAVEAPQLLSRRPNPQYPSIQVKKFRQ